MSNSVIFIAVFPVALSAAILLYLMREKKRILAAQENRGKKDQSDV